MSTTTLDSMGGIAPPTAGATSIRGLPARIFARIVAAHGARARALALGYFGTLADADLANLGYSPAQIRALRARRTAMPATWI